MVLSVGWILISACLGFVCILVNWYVSLSEICEVKYCGAALRDNTYLMHIRYPRIPVFLCASSLYHSCSPKAFSVNCNPTSVFPVTVGFLPSSDGVIGAAMSCSLFLFEEDGASSLGDNGMSNSHTTVDCFSQGRDWLEHGKSGRGVFIVSGEPGVPHMTVGHTTNLQHLSECT